MSNQFSECLKYFGLNFTSDSTLSYTERLLVQFCRDPSLDFLEQYESVFDSETKKKIYEFLNT